MSEQLPQVVTPVAAQPRLRMPAWLSWRRLAIVVGAYLACVVVFAAFAAWQGADPGTLLPAMLQSTVLNPTALTQTLLRAVPIGFAALAAVVPARAGLVNVGAEGQLIMGAVAATGVGLAVGTHVPGPLALIATVAAGGVAGAVWAGISAVFRIWFRAAESVTSLLLNFVASDVMLFLIYEPWKDPAGSGQPQSRPLPGDVRLGDLTSTGLNASVIVLALAAVGVWLLLRRTGWGFALRVIGGNPEAARRSALPSWSLLLSAMLVGGLLAGLGGALNLIGVEGQLRPGITTTFGYVGFLAAFLGRNDAIRATLAALLFAAIALSGNGLQLVAGLDGNIVNVLLGSIVLTMLLVGRTQGERL
ncbi:ABC transporter permease [Gryllotalpicola protaetiae]|uniref:ABC transporter permease n=1 Tax=Gryllotalpicola protaetiae TaxID=2419771 RepID=A0A387BQJ0_9MICO|nr:ABC transporter permease [Gryllotalpicola protaetiae]AYG03246.1 ABC transporter permease [Gryllotalpicola protaetiae]